jgi:predicted  nucleic acid-binding Zn-ribbon protein
MESNDLTIEILKGIREETHKTNERLDELRTEVRTGLASVRGEVAHLRADVGDLRTEVGDLRGDVGALGNRQTASEMRLATELVAVTGAVREVRDLLREDRALVHRVDDHERRIAAMEGRVG